MSEELYHEELDFPDLNQMLSMSVHYENLQSTVGFMLGLLKKHESGLRTVISKQNMLAPDVLSLHAFKQALDLRLKSLEKSAKKSNNKIEELKNNIDGQKEHVETLKFILNMLTTHDSQILHYKRQLEELQSAKVESDNRIAAIEEKIKVGHDSQKRIKKTSEEEEYENEEEIKIKDYSMKDNPRRYRPTKASKKSLLKQPDRKPLISKVFEDSLATPPLVSPISSNDHSGIKDRTFGLTAPQKSFESNDLALKVQILERNIESLKTSVEANNNRLCEIESMCDFIESAVDYCEPLAQRNKKDISNISKILRRLEADMVNKLDVEDFNAIKLLVISIASGDAKLDFTTLLPVREVNLIRLLEKKLLALEISLSESVRIYPENIEEVSIKLRRIEQKLEIKTNTHQFEELKSQITETEEKLKSLTGSLTNNKDIIKSDNKSSNRNLDTMLYNSINRRLSSFEDQLRPLRLPVGVDLSSIWEETKKNSSATNYLLSSLSEVKSSESQKYSDLTSILNHKADIASLSTIEEKYRKLLHESTTKLSTTFVEKPELRKALKFLEELVRSHDAKKPSISDEAMLARKPLNGWTCASCEKKLEPLTGRPTNHSPWERLPLRDASERILKAGPAFSKMLTTIQLSAVKSKSQLSSTFTNRSITPQP